MNPYLTAVKEVMDLAAVISKHSRESDDHSVTKAALIALCWRHDHHEGADYPNISSDIYWNVVHGKSVYVRLYSDGILFTVGDTGVDKRLSCGTI